jgi:hypothetical protein
MRRGNRVSQVGKLHWQLCCGALLLLAMGHVEAWGGEYRVAARQDWETWTYAPGTVELGADGSVTLARFRARTNAAADAPRFAHRIAGGSTATGGIWDAGSGKASAALAIDGDPRTCWKPDPGADVENWWLQIDLGRLVAVTSIRLTFPDSSGARPLREFRVFGSTGERMSVLSDLFSFSLLGGTTRWNTETQVEYDMQSIVDSQRIVVDVGGAAAALDTVPYLTLQYIRVRVDAKSEDAALAEVEVLTFGDNAALGTLQRGGSVTEETQRGSAMVDGDANTSWADDWLPGETVRWYWDLGATLWVDRMVVIGRPPAARQVRRVYDHSVYVSDGAVSLSGEVAYEFLTELDTGAGAGTGSQEIEYVLSAPKRMRYLSSQYVQVPGDIAELLLYSPGSVAETQLTSGFIDLGAYAGDNRAKQIMKVLWDAEGGPGAQVQVRTRSGNELREVITYYHRNGTQVSEAEYYKLNTFLRGRKETSLDAGADWSQWSSPYSASGLGFQSPSPRRYLQIRLTLGSLQPESTTRLHSLGVQFEDALLAAVVGQIEPTIASAGVETGFSYRLLPRYAQGDQGFNRVLLRFPGRVHDDSVAVRIGGQTVQAVVAASGDSLVLGLPRTVTRDSVEVRFWMRVSSSPTQVEVSVANSRSPEQWQAVQPAELLSASVFFPEVPRQGRFIDRLSVTPRVMTPNGDGIGDRGEIRLETIGAYGAPTVWIYALNGDLVAELAGIHEPGGTWLYVWEGRDEHGQLVAPGLYLCRARVRAQIGDDAAAAVIPVAY